MMKVPHSVLTECQKYRRAVLMNQLFDDRIPPDIEYHEKQCGECAILTKWYCYNRTTACGPEPIHN